MQAAASLKERIQAEAEHLGFSLFGVALPQRPLHYQAYLDWIAAGRQAGMDYLARPDSLRKRGDPSTLMDGCRSIVCLGIRYHRPEDAPPAPSVPAGRVAAYAWGDDYHEVVVPRLRSLADRAAEDSGRPVLARPYTDTGPLLERDLAMQAGLGWIGKNSCLINPALGSYFLLAELLLDVDLEPDLPFRADYCGSCTRCIESCPTDAIRPDRTLESGRCISYLTIENKGSIPHALRPLLGDWVFGCDICQLVCPWNLRFAGPGADPAFHPRPGAARPPLDETLRLTPAQFNQLYQRSPVRRAKRRGLLRNAAVAAGNLRDESLVRELARLLRSEPEALVRAHAAWALGQIASPDARTALHGASLSEQDLDVREEIRAALDSAAANK